MASNNRDLENPLIAALPYHPSDDVNVASGNVSSGDYGSDVNSKEGSLGTVDEAETVSAEISQPLTQQLVTRGKKCAA
jgi:hypothetical protein